MSRTERAIKADLLERRALLAAERERAVADYQRLGQAIPMLTGALSEVDRLLSGFSENGAHANGHANGAGTPDDQAGDLPA